MIRYKKLEVGEAIEFIQYIRSLHFKTLEKDDYFVEPWSNNVLADCIVFQLSEDKSSKIYFFVINTELIDFLKSTPKLYLYGAYNQVMVCQMRVKGLVSIEADNPEEANIRKNSRVRVETRINKLVNGISEDDAEERFEIIEKGKLFCFYPEEYAYSTYERG